MSKKTEYFLQIITATLLFVIYIFLIKHNIETGNGWPGLAIGLSVVMLLNQKVGFIKRRKLDEREYQLFYRSNSITFALTMIVTAVIKILCDESINSTFFLDNWFKLFLLSVLMVNGIVGYFVFRKG